MKKYMKELKYEYVKSLKLAGFLMQNGFRILRVEPNAKFKEKDVYVFEQSKKLSDCIFEYINLRTKEKKNYGDYNENGDQLWYWDAEFTQLWEECPSHNV